MLIPSCTQRSRKSGVVIPAHFCEVFSGFHLRLHIQAPQFDQLGQDLINGKGVELVQELLRAVRHIGRVRMTGHQPCQILEHLQTEQIEVGIVLLILTHTLFQLAQVLVNVAAELDAVQAMAQTALALKVTSLPSISIFLVTAIIVILQNFM